MAETESRSDGLRQHYWATWQTMFAIQAMSLILGLSVAIPVISLATNRALASSRNARLSDTDLLDFLTGSSFPLIVIAVAAIWVTVHVFGYAAQLFAAHASYHGAPVSVFTALRKTGRSFLPITKLAARFFLQLFIVSLPFLLVIVGVLSIQIKDNDLADYLTYHPPEFIFAVALALIVFAIMALVMLRITARWAYALPLVLFHGETPLTARRISRKKSRTNRTGILFSFALWSIGTPLLVLILNSAWLPLALWASKALGHRLGLLALLLSVLILVTIAIATIVGFISLTILALHHVRLYRRAGLDHDDPPTTPEPIIPIPIRSGIVAFVVVTGLLTIGLSYRWLDGLRIADHAQVIALRGASADSPENTVASVLRAFDHRAHSVAVRQRAGQEFLVFADADFSRVAGNSLKLDEATIEDLATIDIGSWVHSKYHEERVPTLHQVIQLCGGGSGLMLILPDIADEKKRTEFFEKLIKHLEIENIVARTRIVCAQPEHVPEIHAILPTLKAGFKSPVMIDRALSTQVDFVIVPAITLRHDLINNLHRNGIEVIAADTMDPVIMSSVLSRGADGLLITAPGIGHKVLEERASLNPGERLLVEFITRIRDSLPRAGSQASVSQ